MPDGTLVSQLHLVRFVKFLSPDTLYIVLDSLAVLATFYISSYVSAIFSLQTISSHLLAPPSPLQIP